MSKPPAKEPAPKRRQRLRDEEEKRIKRAFAANLRRCMEEAGYDTNWQLMLDSGVGNATIGRYLDASMEAGIVKVARLARALGVPVSELLRDPQAPTASPSPGRRRTDREGPLLPGSRGRTAQPADASGTDAARGASS